VNELHYGDNLAAMREKIPDEAADLIFRLSQKVRTNGQDD
jgi:hypothetical protein